jgi:hypothetical protein
MVEVKRPDQRIFSLPLTITELSFLCDLIEAEKNENEERGYQVGRQLSSLIEKTDELLRESKK